MSKRLQGLNAWILQRVSALYLAVFLIYLVGVFVFAPFTDYAEFRNWVIRPPVSIALVIFVIMILGHVWVGIRDVFMDYIASLAVRAAMFVVLATGLIALAVWFVRIIVIATLK